MLPDTTPALEEDSSAFDPADLPKVGDVLSWTKPDGSIETITVDFMDSIEISDSPSS